MPQGYSTTRGFGVDFGALAQQRPHSMPVHLFRRVPERRSISWSCSIDIDLLALEEHWKDFVIAAWVRFA